MKRIIALIWLAVALCTAPAAFAQDFPKLTGRVVDAANIIPAAEEAMLGQKLAEFETRTQRQFVVATVPDLQGYDIADFGYRLGRAWGIGDEERNDGVLLIVAPNERKVRIEVGYGLEPVLTDGLSFLIINRQILPRFKSGDMPGGIVAGTDAVIEQLELPPEEAAKIAAQAEQQAAGEREGDGINMFEIIFLLIFLFFFIIPLLRGLRGGHRYRGSGPVIIWGGDDHWGGGSGGGGFGGGFGGGGGFSGGGGSFGGGGASGGW
ncbi:YgcG family protein [Croceicoccus sp. Ery15]|uniref:TPM domain-containing protein n=1 Tax=Croceicoccus sp. Ery15 TaxID=1703338 RepID=UPI001E2B1B27|nr:TPM domain-containing protein [Croceicoccus sp. Ery15]